jgi:hypothetical protein
MKLTNRFEFPDAVVAAVRNDTYSKGDADISVTGLLKPPKMSQLTFLHDEEIVEDVSERIWALLGQLVHGLLERANVKGVAERRLSIEVEGWKVSGAMDLHEDHGYLTDYKLTSVWKLVKGDLDEWEKQMNLYAVLLRAKGHAVTKMQIVAILRDWSKREAEKDPTYPQAQIVNVIIPLWAPEKAEAYMRDRVILHKQARLTGELPDCTDKERWVRDEKWAVKKIGQKRAVNGGVFDTLAAAQAFMGFDKDKEIEHRPGVSTRCQSYCQAFKWCKQGQSYVSQSAERSAPETSTEKQTA